uniref:Uncharacterized protein n=1 Tax=Gasterosteus aculeatus aculeatus TaxID=481459 RepID=A0AAQ4Q5S6_GASAC
CVIYRYISIYNDSTIAPVRFLTQSDDFSNFSDCLEKLHQIPKLFLQGSVLHFYLINPSCSHNSLT